MKCLDCGHPAIKNGLDRLQDGTIIQTYRCQGCSKRFNQRTGTPMARLRTPTHTVLPHRPRLSLRKTLRELGRAVILIIFLYCFISCEKPQQVIQPKFSNVATFSNGLALVEIVPITNLYAVAREGMYLPEPDNKHDSRYGFIDKNGNTVIQPQFIDYFSSFNPAFHLFYTFLNQSSDYTFSEGLALVKIGDKYGFIDKSGNRVIQPQFNDAKPFSEGLALVRISAHWGFIDKRGKIVIQPQFKDADPFSEGLALALIGKKYGFIDRSGNIVIQPQFDSGKPFSEGLALVKIGKKYGFINKRGHMVIAPQFNNAAPFSEGLALVNIDDKYDKYGFIDKSGNIVIQPRFDSNTWNSDYKPAKQLSGFSEGLALVRIDDKYGFIDKSGKIVIPPKIYNAEPFSEGLAQVSNDKSEYGFIDKSGKIVIPLQFKQTTPFSEGLALVIIEDKHGVRRGFIDKSGNIVLNL